jgi:hypothetical protein
VRHAAPARRRIRAIATAALLGLAALPMAGHLRAQGVNAVAARSPRIASYQIRARLDVRSRILTGQELIVWTNATEHAVSELRVHLYYNAWRDERSSWIRAARRSTRPPNLSAYGPNDWGYCDVESVTQLGDDGSSTTGVPLPVAFVQPDDGNADDRTVLRIQLAAPVAGGQQVRLDVRWRLKIPRPFERVGVIGPYYLVGQWFPKVGVLQPDGTWNCHQFVQTEFFSDFGVYDVELTVADGWKVGATGTRVSSTANADATTTHRFHAEDVHDFAWTTSPLFLVHTDRFESPTLPPVDIELLLMPDHARLKDRYLASAKAALERYGSWFRAYPWSRITIVDPPSDSDTGGMEYPMFVTGESRWLTLPSNRLAEANTLHEIGHAWWQGAVANNEFEDAWLDESLNTYAHKRVLDEIYPPKTYEKRYFHDFIPFAFPDLPWAQTTHGADIYDGFRSAFKLDALATPANRNDERAYFVLPYLKGALLLVTLERHLGWDVWRRVLSTYAERFWFRHPRPADFIAVVNEVGGRDLNWFFDEAYRGTALFDYAVDRVSSRRLAAPRGYEDIDGSAGPAWRAGGAGLAPPIYESTVDLRRWGGAVFPVDVRVVFVDGSEQQEQWDGRAPWTRFAYQRSSPVQQVEVDPRHVLVLDVNYSNNSWTRTPASAPAAVKWTSKWMIWMQSILELTAFFA